MRIKFFNWLVVVEILTIFFIPVIAFAPSIVIRLILGIPLLLYFPGYTLIEALFARKDQNLISDKKKGIDGLERIALSFGMSIAISGLIGLCLNFTPIGIHLEPLYYCVLGFIIIMANIAIARRARYTDGRLIQEYKIKLPDWEGSPLNKLLSFILIIAVLATAGTLIIAIASPKVGEKFTQFYILGLNNKAQEYPVQVVVRDARVTQVIYGDGAPAVDDSRLQVTLGVVNQERKDTSYTVIVRVNDQPVDFSYVDASENSSGKIVLQPGQQWERVITFAPFGEPSPAGSMITAGKMRVDFLLYKDNSSEVFQSLHLWVDIVSA
jgi:uncharacterized membrane protein